MPVGRFLGGIAAVVYHPATATYLLLRRAADRDAGGGEWECVTGRVDQGEGFEDALHREVREELGVSVRPDFIVGTSHFYRGTAVPENELLGVLYACTLDAPDTIRVSAEHSEHRWLTAAAVFNLLPPDHWLHRTIRRAELMRPALPATLIATHRDAGFEHG